MSKRTLTLLVLGAGISCAIAAFGTVAAAPCDPSLPVLPDGTREAPGNWFKVWFWLELASAAFLGLATGLAMRFVSDPPRSSGKSVGLGIGTGVAALIALWIVDAVFWLNQCPT